MSPDATETGAKEEEALACSCHLGRKHRTRISSKSLPVEVLFLNFGRATQPLWHVHHNDDQLYFFSIYF